MKKVFLIFFIWLLLLSFCACDKGGKPFAESTPNVTTGNETTTVTTTIEQKPDDTPESVYAAGQKSLRGVYTVTCMNQETGDSSEYNLAYDGEKVYLFSFNGFTYIDKGDRGYLSSDGAGLLLMGDGYADFRVLVNERIEKWLPPAEIDLMDATLEEGGDELTIFLATESESIFPCYLTYIRDGDLIVLTDAVVCSQNNCYFIEKADNEPSEDFITYEDKSELLPLLTAMLRITSGNASVSGNVTFINETDTYTGAFSQDSRIHFAEREFWLDATLTGTQDETPLRLQLLQNETDFSFTFSDLITVVVDKQELAGALEALLLLSELPSQELPEEPEHPGQEPDLSSVPEPTVTFEGENIIIVFEGDVPLTLTVSVGENDALTVSVSSFTVPSTGTFSSTATIAPVTESQMLPQMAPDAPVYIDAAGITNLLQAVSMLSDAPAYRAQGTLLLSAMGREILSVNYSALFETGDSLKAYIVLDIPYIVALTDEGVTDFIPEGSQAYKGTLKTIIRIIDGYVYIDKEVTASYAALFPVPSSGKASKTYRTKMPLSVFVSQLGDLLPLLLNINADTLSEPTGSTFSYGMTELYLSSPGTERVLTFTYNETEKSYTLEGNLVTAAELLYQRGFIEQVPEYPEMLSDTDMKLVIHLEETEEYGVPVYTLGTVIMSFSPNENISVSVTVNITETDSIGDNLTLFPENLATDAAYPLYPAIS